jgi:hypothetical protein
MSSTREARAPTAQHQLGAAGGPRLLVPDVLRGGAILAMLLAHAAPLLGRVPEPWRVFTASANDVASPLFALVMGMSAQLVTQRTDRAGRARMLVQQALRALALVLLGVWMGTWGSWVAVVLAQLGLVLVVGAPLLLLRTRWLAVVTAVLAVVSAPVNHWARSELAWVYADPGSPAFRVADWVVLGAHYRVTNLLPFFLLGALLLRHGIRRDRVLWAMLAVAPVAYVVLPVLLRLDPSADVSSGSLPDTLHDVGLVFLVYGVTVVVATAHHSQPWARSAGRVLVPLAAVGAVSLSLYVLHVGVLALWADEGFRPGINDYLRWLVIVPGMMAVGYAWGRSVGRGPLEWAMGVVTGRRTALRSRPPGERGGGAAAR